MKLEGNKAVEGSHVHAHVWVYDYDVAGGFCRDCAINKEDWQQERIAELEAQNATMREIVQQVAALWVHYDPDDNVSLYSHGYKIDVADLVDKAQKLLNERAK